MVKPDFKLDFVNEFIEQAGKLMPGTQTRDELQKTLRIVAQSTLSKLDLVTREEFDRQVVILQSSSAKVRELENQIEELTKQLSLKGGQDLT